MVKVIYSYILTPLKSWKHFVKGLYASTWREVVIFAYLNEGLRKKGWSSLSCMLAWVKMVLSLHHNSYIAAMFW
jgi:hypothetical protein